MEQRLKLKNKNMSKLNERKLYRSKNDKIIAGVFGGLGDYFDIDSNLLRVIVLFLLFLTFFGGLIPFLIVYFIVMFIIPSEGDKNRKEGENEDKNFSRNPIYKKWVFWLIIAIFLFPIILMILGFLFFAVRTDIITDSIEVREERIIIDRSDDSSDYIRIYREK